MARKIKRKYVKYDSASDLLQYTFEYNDTETEELHRINNRNTEIGIDDLRRISLWKINRVLSVSDETITKLRNIADADDLTIESAEAESVIEDLVLSDGIGFPMASAILKFLRPDVFPIIDVRAYRALTGTKPYYSTYSYEKYKEYTLSLTTEAENLNRPLAEMDEQLYCFDEEKNGKI